MSYAPIYNELVEKATTRPLEYRYSELWEALLRAEKYIVKMETLQSAAPEALQKPDAAEAAYTFRESLIPRADLVHGKYPLWHGWAIYDAFVAGAEWARSPRGKQP